MIDSHTTGSNGLDFENQYLKMRLIGIKADNGSPQIFFNLENKTDFTFSLRFVPPDNRQRDYIKSIFNVKLKPRADLWDTPIQIQTYGNPLAGSRFTLVLEGILTTLRPEYEEELNEWNKRNDPDQPPPLEHNYKVFFRKTVVFPVFPYIEIN